MRRANTDDRVLSLCRTVMAADSTGDELRPLALRGAWWLLICLAHAIDCGPALHELDKADAYCRMLEKGVFGLSDRPSLFVECAARCMLVAIGELDETL